MSIRLASWIAVAVLATGCGADEPRGDVAAELKAALADAEARIKADPGDLQALSDRGDNLFFLGRFEEAVRDYDRMIELAPEIEPKHWQRGLALYYAGRYDDSAKQFERYYGLDQSDRENGIWRFYAQVKKEGLTEARKKLLIYAAPDREPLPLVYRMCAGDASPEDVLQSVEAADVSASAKSQRQFYADLYVGLDAAIVRNDPVAARPLLERAVKNPWSREGSYGPKFMWHVARLSLERLETKAP